MSLCGYANKPCDRCDIVKDPDECSRWKICPAYLTWFEKTWTHSGGQPTPGGEITGFAGSKDEAKPKACAVCGKVIPRGSKRSKFCSDECRKTEQYFRLQAEQKDYRKG